MNRFYITTPIYYVNSDLHLGHAYTTVLADVFSRYHRLMGHETHFLTGTDEHGQKVLEASNRLGVSPREHCDEMSARFKALWSRLNVRQDRFIRTTDADHVALVTRCLQQLHDQGHLYTQDYEGWYDVKSERFFTEKDLVDGRSPDGNEVVKLREKNWFFRMSAFQQWLVDHIQANPEFIQPEQRRNEVLGFLRQPLQDLCISRPKSRMDWGIELPFDREYVCYVWVDALLNYVTGSGPESRSEVAGEWWPASTHLIGKDILTTHCVYWPTLLRALAWAEYLRTHAERIYAAGTGPSTEGATALLKRIRAGKVVDGFSARDVYVNGPAHLNTPELVYTATDLLCDLDYLRRIDIKPGASGGRPSAMFQINPMVIAEVSP